MWNFGLVLVAGGSSTRMGGRGSKLFEHIAGRTVFERVLRAFEQAECIDRAVVACRDEDLEMIAKLCSGFKKPIKLVRGGTTRQQSVFRGIEEMPDADYYVIHDAARPLISPEIIDRTCRDALINRASACAVNAKDTIKIIDQDGFVLETPPRDALMMVQTPQVFARELYLAAKAKAEKEKLEFTDDCQLVERFGYRVHMVQGDYQNIKITTPDDLLAANAYAKGKVKTRVGYGYDVHRFETDRALILGGVHVPFVKGLSGHSDADVLVHAVMDALLGAACLGDIGMHFPDTDPQYKGADSLVLLCATVEKITNLGFTIENIDATVCAQRPKLAPYISLMRQRIASVCNLSETDINIKATTEEGLGFTGREEGISAAAVVMLSRMEAGAD